ncbi:DUF397 domain-containing protein [Streptomyces xiaopingdaonensis]|uniref:DUF397 domain-containing protein n=1 Tax=Streptomyces xiaopingdaonensis TaxID=1565415 RepID=UPI0003197895|nr:DUF397 domain-containing protein [Streptomyces xiaopingdaonensis]
MEWIKSSHSSGEGGQCVEIAACREAIHVRDSKSATEPVLNHSPDVWAEFVAFVARQG